MDRPRLDPRSVRRAWIVFVAALIAGHIVIEGAGAGYEAWVNRCTARAAGRGLSALGIDARVVGDVVTGAAGTAAFALQIVRECTAESPLILLVAAILAYPCGPRDKAVGLALGIPALVVLNEIRLVSLFWIGLRRRELFEITHLVVWQSLMVLAVVGLWLLWVRRWVDRDARRAA